MFPDAFCSMEGVLLKRIVIYLHYTKYNEISMFNSDIKKHVSYIGLYKRFLMYKNGFK